MAPSEALREQLDAHAAAELTFDVQAVMATVDDDCFYEWLPDGRVLRGADACRRMYEAFLPRWRDLAATRNLRFEIRSEAWSEHGRIREHVARLDDGHGGESRHDFVVMVEPGARGIRAERTYASTELHRLLLGAHYDALATTSAPPVHGTRGPTV